MAVSPLLEIDQRIRPDASRRGALRSADSSLPSTSSHSRIRSGQPICLSNRSSVQTSTSQVVLAYRLRLQTQCDSEVLGHLMARFSGRLVRRAALTASAANGNLAVLGVWRDPARLLIVRDTRPLHFGEANRGFYFGSLPEGLPGDVRSLPDRYAGVLTFDGRELHLAAGPISQMVAR